MATIQCLIILFIMGMSSIIIDNIKNWRIKWEQKRINKMI